MSKKTSLVIVADCNDLIPHESNALNLMFFDAFGNGLIYVDEAFMIEFGCIDDDSPAVSVQVTADSGKLS